MKLKTVFLQLTLCIATPILLAISGCFNALHLTYEMDYCCVILHVLLADLKR